MAIVNQIEKKIRMTNSEGIKYQLITYCFINNITISDADLCFLTILATTGEQELNYFCKHIHEANIFQSTQTVRNAISKAEKKNLIVKAGKNKKKISINPTLNLFTEGNYLLEYKILALAS